MAYLLYQGGTPYFCLNSFGKCIKDKFLLCSGGMMELWQGKEYVRSFS